MASTPKDLKRQAELYAARLLGCIVIDGKLVKLAGDTFDLINSATREVIGSVPQCSANDVDTAVQSAKKAQRFWGKYAAQERGRILYQCADLVLVHQEELALLMTLETGQSLRTVCRPEVQVMADTFRYFAGLTMELKGETIPLNPNTLTMTVREPLGVVGGITPWNVPMMLMALKVAPALAAGNSIVLKSSEEAPLAVLRVAELLGGLLPPGLFNVISGDGLQTGVALVKHPGVMKVTFTGSVEAGKSVYRNAADKLISVTLELGGKSPMIVCADADLARAIDGAMAGMRLIRQGQSCSAATRMFVHISLIKDFIEGFKVKASTLKMGDPFDEFNDVGSVISQKQWDRIHRYLTLAEQTPGATLHHCGDLDPALVDGFFLRPVIIEGLTNDHPAVREEIFGPVTCVIPFDDFDDVIAMANDTTYGLAATLWTKDLKVALDGAHRLNAGYIQVNQNHVVRPGAPYGGFAWSGLGKEASLDAMVDHFTRLKTIMINRE